MATQAVTISQWPSGRPAAALSTEGRSASHLSRGEQRGAVALLERRGQACAPRLYGTATRDVTAEQRSLKGHVCAKTGSVPGSIFDCENHGTSSFVCVPGLTCATLVPNLPCTRNLIQGNSIA